MENINACSDNPSPLDFKFSELIWSLTEQEKKIFPIELLQIFNQWTDPDTIYSCTRQGLWNITNWNNILGQNSQDILLWKKEWMKAIEANPSIKNSWDYLQNALKQFQNDKLIAWYTVINTIEEAKQAIDRGNYIYTGSNNWNWNSVRDNNLYKIKQNSFGHAFVFWIWYNDTWFIWINSYGQENGQFTIPYELFNTTFTKYAIQDFIDQDAILLLKTKKMEERKQRIIDLWISNGLNPDMNITRNETMLMLWKLVELIELKFWKLN